MHLLWLMVLAPNLVYFTFIGMRGQPYTLAINSLTMTVYVGLVMVKLGLPLRGIESNPAQRQLAHTSRRRRTARPQPRLRPSRRMPQAYKLATSNRPNQGPANP